MPMAASSARTAAVDAGGGTSQVPALVAAGIVVVVIMSASDVTRRASHPASGLLGPDTSQSDALMRYTRSGLPRMASLPGLVIYRFAGAMFYANADAMTEEVAQIVASTPDVEWFILDAEAVVDIDPTAADALADVQSIVAAAGARFGITRVNAGHQPSAEAG